MQLAEGHRRSETKPPPFTAGTGRAGEPTPWNSDSPTLDDAFLDRSANVKNHSTAWTDKKHSLYLDHLEVSFVKHLHQSMGLLTQCSEQNKRDENVCRMNPKLYYLKCIETQFPPASDDMQECWRLSALENCSHQFSANNQHHEGTGQNFADEDDQNKSNTDSQVKRLKTALAD